MKTRTFLIVLSISVSACSSEAISPGDKIDVPGSGANFGVLQSGSMGQDVRTPPPLPEGHFSSAPPPPPPPSDLVAVTRVEPLQTDRSSAEKAMRALLADSRVNTIDVQLKKVSEVAEEGRQSVSLVLASNSQVWEAHVTGELVEPGGTHIPASNGREIVPTSKEMTVVLAGSDLRILYLGMKNPTFVERDR